MHTRVFDRFRFEKYPKPNKIPFRYFVGERFLVSLGQLQEIPFRNLILLVGPPGSGKTTFCYQSILRNLTLDRPIIYVLTEISPSETEKSLKEEGLAEVEPDSLNYVDAYNQTVGVSVPSIVSCDSASFDSGNSSAFGSSVVSGSSAT